MSSSRPKSKPCYGCDIPIHFDDRVRSPSGKAIPLEENGEPHQCPKPRYTTDSGPKTSVAIAGNPPLKTISPAWLKNDVLKTQQDLKDDEIKKAQAERRAQHTEYMIALKNLTKTIMYQISRDHNEDVGDIEAAIGFEQYKEDQEIDRADGEIEKGSEF